MALAPANCSFLASGYMLGVDSVFDGLSENELLGASYMEYPVTIERSVALIRVEGDLDTEQSAKVLTNAFERAIGTDGVTSIVLDLRGVGVINSYGIGKILMFYKRLRAENKALKTKPLVGHVKETFELLMLDKLISVVE